MNVFVRHADFLGFCAFCARIGIDGILHGRILMLPDQLAGFFGCGFVQTGLLIHIHVLHRHAQCPGFLLLLHSDVILLKAEPFAFGLWGSGERSSYL